MLRTRLSRTSLIQFGLLAYLSGLWLAHWGWVVSGQVLVSALFPLIIIVRNSAFSVVVIVTFALVLGIWYGQRTVWQLSAYARLYDQKTVLLGTIQDDPAFNEDGQLEFHLTDIRLETGERLIGRVRVGAFVGATKLSRGDRVRAAGKLRPALGNRQGQITFATIDHIGKSASRLEVLRKRFMAGIYTSLVDPRGSLGLGFLVGSRTLLPETLMEQLSRTGLTHIVAVSGYNLTILVRICRRLLARYSKYLAVSTSFGLMAGFVAIAGFSPSLFRAAVVSTLMLLSWYVGRTIKPLLLILLAAALTSSVNPLYLWFDIGWWLSFLAFFGILVLAPALMNRVFSKEPPWLLQLLIESVAAQAMVLPLLMFIFGEVSMISLLANVLVLPLIPLAMTTTFVAGLAGMTLPELAGWFSLPAHVVLGIIIKVVAEAAAFPWAYTELSLSQTQMIILYALIVSIIVLVKKAPKTSVPVVQ